MAFILLICLIFSSEFVTGQWISNINPITFSKRTIEYLLNNGGYAIISAGRNPSIWSDFNLTNEMITKRTENLIDDIENIFLYTPMFGVYDGGAEQSFLLVLHNTSPNKEREKLIRLGEKYNQDSIIYVRQVQPTVQQMIYTTGRYQGRYIQGKGYRKLPLDIMDNYSRLELCPNGTYQFTLNFHFDQMEMITNELIDHHQANREMNKGRKSMA